MYVVYVSMNRVFRYYINIGTFDRASYNFKISFFADPYTIKITVVSEMKYIVAKILYTLQKSTDMSIKITLRASTQLKIE